MEAYPALQNIFATYFHQDAHFILEREEGMPKMLLNIAIVGANFSEVLNTSSRNYLIQLSEELRVILNKYPNREKLESFLGESGSPQWRFYGGSIDTYALFEEIRETINKYCS